MLRRGQGRSLLPTEFRRVAIFDPALATVKNPGHSRCPVSANRFRPMMCSPEAGTSLRVTGWKAYTLPVAFGGQFPKPTPLRHSTLDQTFRLGVAFLSARSRRHLAVGFLFLDCSNVVLDVLPPCAAFGDVFVIGVTGREQRGFQIFFGLASDSKNRTASAPARRTCR